MANFLDDQTDAKRLAQWIAGLDQRLGALERSTQASFTSIEGGSLDIYDDEGTLKASIGVQPDGTVALVPVNSEPPPTPTAPSVEPVLAGLLVGWDGLWDDSYSSPSDFSLIQVHVGAAADFTPDLTTHAATITAPLGGTVTIAVDGYAPVWVRLVGQNTAAVTGPASAAVQGQPRQAVPQDLIDGIVTETKIAKDAITAAKIALGAVTAPALADGAVNINALGGALSDSAAQRYVDTMTDPAAWVVTERGTGATWEHVSGVSDAPTGPYVGRATGYVRLQGTTAIPYEPNVLYRLSARIRLTAPASGTDQFFVGVAGIGADGTTLINRNGLISPTQHYYVAASARPLDKAGGWVQVIGFLNGRAAAGATGSAGPNNDPRSAGVVHADVRFIAPYVWLNYNGLGAASSSIMEVDCVTLEALKTGTVDSVNLVAGSVVTAALATDAVTAGKIAADAVTAGKIAADAVTTRELKADSVTAPKILAGAVTTDKLLALAVTAEKIAALAVTTEKLDALAVTADKLAANSVTATKILAGTIDATHIKAGSISADRLTIGTSPNMLPDPSFEGAGGAALVSGQTFWSIASTGNGSAKSIQVNAVSATAVIRTLTLATFPILPGQGLRLATDVRPSADWNGASVRIYARWIDAAGGVTFGFVTNTAPAKDAWSTLDGTVTAPTGTVSAEIRLASYDATAGSVLYDNAIIQPLVGKVQIADGAVTAAKVAAGVIDATHIKAGALTADRLAVGVDGNLIADPSFEGAISQQRVAGTPAWTVVSGGNGTPFALRHNATINEEMRLLGPIPAVPGQKVFLAADYFASADWAGDAVLIYAEWRDAAGTPLDWATVTSAGSTVTGTWTRLSAIASTAAPANTAQVVVRIKTLNGTAGSVLWDNAVARFVTASGSAGARAEISPLGLQLYDDAGEEAVSLVTGRPNYLTLSAGGVPVATIDQLGNAGFGDLSVAGTLSVGGDSITSLMATGPRGIIALSQQFNTSVTASTTDYGYVELAFEADVTRTYRIVLDVYANSSVGGGEVVLSFKDGGASAPIINSPQIQSAIFPAPAAGLRRVRMELVRTGAQFGAGLHRLLTTFHASTGNVTLSSGGGWPGLFYIEDIGPSLTDTGVFNTGGGTAAPAKKTYTKTYGAIWSGSYANRGAYNSYYGNQMMCGYYSSANGVQASLVGFNAQLATDLSGATINKAEVYLYFDHWYSNAGGTAVIKAHKHTSRPSTFSCDPEAKSISWKRNEGKWVDITSVFDSTTWRGIAIDPNSTSSTYYGSARGVGQTYPPQLRVTYTK
ncbi:hypothetical protein AB0G49_14025 [Streptomyces longwoodensis]|uniref:hypothetical protein n=1 Tax=Streptomyces longwoodensis TaxID=68231 RepID=UPI0034115011